MKSLGRLVDELGGVIGGGGRDEGGSSGNSEKRWDSEFTLEIELTGLTKCIGHRVWEEKELWMIPSFFGLNNPKKWVKLVDILLRGGWTQSFSLCAMLTGDALRLRQLDV